MKTPIIYVSNYLGIGPLQLVQAMATFKTPLGGWLAMINEALMHTLPIKKSVNSIIKTKVSRPRPLVGMK
jgi:hypothetical protein